MVLGLVFVPRYPLRSKTSPDPRLPSSAQVLAATEFLALGLGCLAGNDRHVVLESRAGCQANWYLSSAPAPGHPFRLRQPCAAWALIETP